MPTGPTRRFSDDPVLGQFRIPSWSHINSNPTYQRVANRRATAAVAAAKTSNIEGIKRMALTLVEEEERNVHSRFRPLEDPYLVGEEAAARARRERLARENGEVLFREDRRWDWFLSKSALGSRFLPGLVPFIRLRARSEEREKTNPVSAQVRYWDSRERLRRDFETMSCRPRLARGAIGRF